MLSLESRAKVKLETHIGERSLILVTWGSADHSFWVLWESGSGFLLEKLILFFKSLFLIWEIKLAITHYRFMKVRVTECICAMSVLC